jgi:simple sugar transport system permease protein
VQIDLSLPSSISGLFQGTLLFYLLAADLLIHFRVRRARPAEALPGGPAPPAPRDAATVTGDAPAGADS